MTTHTTYTLTTKQYYSLKEVGEITGLSISTVRRLVKEKEIPATKLGGKWLVGIKELNELLGTDYGGRGS